MNDANVQDTVRCLLGLPLLPAGSICEAFEPEDVALAVVDDNVWGSKVNDLLRCQATVAAEAVDWSGTEQNEQHPVQFHIDISLFFSH